MMNRYEEYQETGFEWLGKIPSNWGLSRVGKFFTERSEKVDDVTYPPLSVTMSGIVDQLSDVAKTNDGGNRKLVKKHDFVINSRSDRKGSSGISPRDGSVSLINIVLEPRELDPQFIQYLFKNYYFKEEYFRNGKGIHWDLWTTRWDQLKNIKFPIPSNKEQELISRYLDKKTEQIDSLIEKIQKKIELLKEQRTSLINQCVTKGLDPNVEMKDSGIEWIGEIPSNWILSKFGFVASLETGNTPSKSEEDLYFTEDQNGFLWVKPSDLDVGFQGVSDSEVKLTFEGKEQSRVIPKDSILVCCIGNTSGKYSIANCDLSTNQQINSITFKDQIFPRYGLYYMDVFGRDLLKWMNFVTLPIISKGDLSQQPVIVPPKSEQIEISEILDKIISEHKVVTELHLQKIQLLKEYRQSLISSVVTGKVRVTEDMV